MKLDKKQIKCINVSNFTLTIEDSVYKMQLVLNTLEQKVLRIAVERSHSTMILIWSGNATPNTTKDGLDPTLSEEEHRYKFVSLPQGGAILLGPLHPTNSECRTHVRVMLLIEE